LGCPLNLFGFIFEKRVFANSTPKACRHNHHTENSFDYFLWALVQTIMLPPSDNSYGNRERQRFSALLGGSGISAHSAGGLGVEFDRTFPKAVWQILAI
jgi:hypothetical protein